MFSKKFTKEERSWICYDWANSVFATIMIAAVFPVFFVAMAGGEGTAGSAWWGWGTATARIILAIAAPVIGAIMDYKGYKKRLFITFVYLGVLFTLLISTQTSWQMLLVGYILANMCFGASNFVYDAYLPDVTTKERMDKVSAWGYAWGYIGGSTIPFIVSIGLLMFGHNFGIDNDMAVRISIVMTALWWGIFAIPMIKNVHHKYGNTVPKKGMFKATLKNVANTAKKITKTKGVLIFLIAYFFYIDGVGTVINMATAYGSELGLDATGMIAALFVTQIVAFPCSMLFGWLAKRVYSINLIKGAIGMYLLICITGFIMGFGLEVNWFDESVAILIFWALAFMVGTVQGGIQAISRSTFGRLVPPEHSGEYFGFFEIYGRFSTILGPFLYATILTITGIPSIAILSIILIFLTGLIILVAGRKHLDAGLRD